MKERDARLGLDSILQQLQVRHDFVSPRRYIDMTDGVAVFSSGTDDTMEVRRRERE